ncbi:ATP-grasp domain-containing protein [Sulfitobacter sp. F26169L]|uniref:carboxyl transferase domain-containing protein n=1 Tax=Sulfitobacter sp. F26169L TaxID=2996015 RepID=UPI002260E02B|nr:carboxyl transferase domain-containing protein [Sulfitobacter sp. F26169L]MCX7567949.1 ATP-grasp domain-containing protein [Sulfitobacter sp. F26169L]
MTQPKIEKLLIANRGEIALRIARTASELGIKTCAIAPQDDLQSLHVLRADEVVTLSGQGARAYLDIDAVIRAGVEAGCDAVHPGYGFLSENAEFARAAQKAGMMFVGPTAESLDMYGDKLSARALAERTDVPTLPGTSDPVDAQGALAFFDTLPDGAAMIVKAVAGGGGRGMRLVEQRDDTENAVAAAAREAKAAFGNPDVYVERFIPSARHIEVQIIGDGAGTVMTLGERDCTLQRRHQKLIEIAPAPNLSDAQRDALHDYARKLAADGNYRSLGTFEFLLDQITDEVFFIEANPRIQVEHTITEEVFGLDLVALQLRIAGGETLKEIVPVSSPRGTAIQTRVNMERVDAQGHAHPSGGTLTAYDPPAGPGLRVDGFTYAGYTTSAAYDSLLVKVIAHAPDFSAALAKSNRALSEFRIDGVETNIAWLRALLTHPDMAGYAVSTRFIETHTADLAAAAAALPVTAYGEPAAARSGAAQQPAPELPQDETAIIAPMQATVISVDVAAGDIVGQGQTLAVLEAMKMEHVITAPQSGSIANVLVAVGATLQEGFAIMSLRAGDGPEARDAQAETRDPDAIRPDLQELFDRQAKGRDAARPAAVQKRHDRGQRTARENLADLVDEDSFNEYGELAIAAQSTRRTRDDLEANTSGDGILTGTGRIGSDLFGEGAARCAFAIGDYTVLAGTQGQRHHRKLDRIFELAGAHSVPLVIFAEGGGGRPGDTDRSNIAGLDCSSFGTLARLSGNVPVIGVAAGRCFAGNAALLGVCDVIIATEDSNIGMAGPAMIEGGGLGSYRPEDIGPIDVQDANGVVDIRVTDEAEACTVARQYLSYFQGDLKDWTAPDPRTLRRVIPENRLRVYDISEVISGLADEGSVLELRRSWGGGMLTALIRIEGKAYGVIANNPKHLGGAIDATAADKAARFMQLCNAHGLPLLSLCDTPGFMVGPEAEKTGLVRHVSRMFVTGAALSVPIYGIVLRKGYGLGAMAMMGGSFHTPFITASWPTGEFGGMGLEGAVRLGYKKELDAETDPEKKQALFEKLLDDYYNEGKAVNYASATEIDAVIDPAQTRRWLCNARNAAPVLQKDGGARFVDTW